MEKAIQEIKGMLKEHGVRISKLEAMLIRQVEKDKKSKGKRKKGTPARGRPGPGAIIDQLIAKGFFTKHRVMVDIIQHCKNNLAHTYKANEFSTPLARAIRNEKLKRQKNKDGKFEYFKQ